jgi:hypothetical protein
VYWTAFFYELKGCFIFLTQCMRVIDWWNKTVCFVPDWKVCKICGRYQILAAILSSQYFSGAWALMYHFTIITITKFYQSVQASQSVLKVHRWKCLHNVQGIYHHVVHGMRLLCVLDTCAKYYSNAYVYHVSLATLV